MRTVKQPIESSDPRLSIVIPSMPGRDYSRPVESLRSQTFQGEYEVLVVVDEELPAHSRNHGLREADGDVVAFTDDDIQPPETWLEYINLHFDLRDPLVCLEGPVVGGINYRGTGEYLGGNLAVDRDTALDIGGFPEHLESPWRDDTFFGWKMERDGDGECHFSTLLPVNHPDPHNTNPSWENEKILMDEFPDRYEERLLSPALLGTIDILNQRFGLSRAVKYVLGIS